MTVFNPRSGGSSSSGVNWITPATGEYIPLFPNILSGNTVVATDRVWLVPFMLPRAVTFSGLAARQQAAGTVSARGCIYNTSLTNKKPTTLLAVSSVVAATTGSRNVDFPLTANAVLAANTLYYYGIQTGDATQTWQCIQNGDPFFQLLKPTKLIADITSNTSEMSLQMTYDAPFGSVPPDLTSVAPKFTTLDPNPAKSSGQNSMPAMWGLVA